MSPTRSALSRLTPHELSWDLQARPRWSLGPQQTELRDPLLCVCVCVEGGAVAGQLAQGTGSLSTGSQGWARCEPDPGA